ncbi:hypothetical protein GLYMA_02G097332v4 [Glycine max]|nr:hypothetical protein GLYMA_02G097332v4 [Glycine max]
MGFLPRWCNLIWRCISIESLVLINGALGSEYSSFEGIEIFSALRLFLLLLPNQWSNKHCKGLKCVQRPRTYLTYSLLMIALCLLGLLLKKLPIYLVS